MLFTENRPIFPEPNGTDISIKSDKDVVFSIKLKDITEIFNGQNKGQYSLNTQNITNELYGILIFISVMCR